jgi:hypothetical protein
VPVVLIIFNRPEMTRKLMEALSRVRPDRLFIVADGPKEDSISKDLVTKTRQVTQQIPWECEVTRIYSEVNLGLRNRVLTGLDEVFKIVDRAIILEDDCIPDDSFFAFSGELLEKYRDDGSISMICGSNFAPNLQDNYSSYFPYTGTSIWGWATWSSVWHQFRSQPESQDWSRHSQKQVGKTFTNWIARYTFMRLMRMGSKLSTWDVSFEVFLRENGYRALVSSVNVISNIGHGLDSTHTSANVFDLLPESEPIIFPLVHPPSLESNPKTEKRMWRKRLLFWIENAMKHPWLFLSKLLQEILIILRRP